MSEIECGLVSIIVPVYNVQDKIKRCIDSVLAQTYPYFELILVDDGSSDDSLSVCRKAAQIDERIIVVSKSNGGVSSARNAGLDRASGKYVMFFDSDDWVDTDILENMVSIQNQNESGLTICGLSMHNGNGGVKLWYPLSSKEIEESTFSEILTDITMTGVLNSPCNKLFLRDKIKSRFNIGKSMGEDMDFNIAYIDEINSISSVPSSIPIKATGQSVSSSAIIKWAIPFNACGTYSLILLISASDKNRWVARTEPSHTSSNRLIKSGVLSVTSSIFIFSFLSVICVIS